MATAKDNLITTRDNFAAKLATESANPKPAYSLNGRSVDWPSFYRFLQEQIGELNKQIALMDNDGAWEVVSQGVTS